MAVRLRVVESKAAGKWRGAGSRGSQSGECGRSAFGKRMQQEAGEELIKGKGHQLLFMVVSGIALNER
jgi:hypothetical protein